MEPFEKKFKQYKRDLDKLTVPDDLDDLMKQSLEKQLPKGQGKNRIWLVSTIAAMVILVTLAGYNYPALAYYSKKILGFDHIPGTLNLLNENGMGQSVEQTIQLEDGLYLTVNGIITDENQLVLFYTYNAPEGLENFDINNYIIWTITGFMTKAGAHGGTSYENVKGTESEGVMYYDAVNTFAKELTLHVTHWDREDYNKEITFAHDPSKAMGATIDERLEETIPLELGELTFYSLKASPTMTLLKGEIDLKSKENEAVDLFAALDGVKLLADGQTVGRSGGSFQSEDDEDEITFEISFNELPEDIEKVELSVESFLGYEAIEGTLPIDEAVDIHGGEVSVKKVEEKDGKMEFTIRSDRLTTLTGLRAVTDSGQVEPEEIIPGDWNTPSTREWAYIFDTKEMPKALMYDGVFYEKEYEKSIILPAKGE